jgi:hypothetical protein
MEMEPGDAAGRGQIGESEPARLTQPRLRHGSKQFGFLYNKFADAGTDTFSIQSTHSTRHPLANNMVNDTYIA